MLRALANAKPTGELVHPDEDAMCEAALADIARGGVSPAADVSYEIEARTK